MQVYFFKAWNYCFIAFIVSVKNQTNVFWLFIQRYCIFLLWVLLRFSFWFSTICMWCAKEWFSLLYCFEVTKLLESVYWYLSSVLENHLPYFFKYIFFLIISFFPWFLLHIYSISDCDQQVSYTAFFYLYTYLFLILCFSLNLSLHLLFYYVLCAIKPIS